MASSSPPAGPAHANGSADLLRLVADSLPTGVLVASADGIIVLVNQRLERLFGYARDEVVGRPVEMLVPEDLREHHVSLRRQFMADPEARRMNSGRDLVGRRRDGSI